MLLTRLLAMLTLVSALACGDDTSGGGRDGGVPDASSPLDATPDSATGCFTSASDAPVGGACGCQMDCTAGTICATEAAAGGPRGICTLLCTDGGGECGAGANCDLVGGASQGVCSQSCTEHTDCRGGWACFYGTCVGLCSEDSHCVSASCDPYQSSCTPEPTGDAGLLETCTLSADCRSGVCDPALGCTTACIPGSDSCPESAACVGGLDPNDRERIGLCVPRCETSSDCPNGRECLERNGERTCLGDAGTECFTSSADAPIGDPCGCDSDCASGTFCLAESEGGDPHGACVALCTEGGGECGAEASCEGTAETGRGACFVPCTEHSECRDGWGCFDGVCTGFCTADSQCLSGSCDPYQNRCGPDPHGEAGVLESCTSSEDCRSAFCASSIGCVTYCVPPGTGSCPESALCVGGVSRDPEIVGVCMPPCETSSDCPAHLECLTTPEGERACFVGA